MKRDARGKKLFAVVAFMVAANVAAVYWWPASVPWSGFVIGAVTGWLICSLPEEDA